MEDAQSCIFLNVSGMVACCQRVRGGGGQRDWRGGSAGENPAGVCSSTAPTFSKFTCLCAPEGGTPGTTEGTGGRERCGSGMRMGKINTGSALKLPSDLEYTPTPLRNKWASARLGVTELGISIMKKACSGYSKSTAFTLRIPGNSTPRYTDSGVGVQTL